MHGTRSDTAKRAPFKGPAALGGVNRPAARANALEGPLRPVARPFFHPAAPRSPAALTRN